MASLDADSGAVRWRHELSGERVLDVTVAGEDIVNVVSVAVDSGLVLARTFRDGFSIVQLMQNPKSYHLYYSMGRHL